MLTVYGVALSPFVRKLMLTLEYKGLAYENEPTFPGSDEAAFRAISPLGKIPVLDHDGFAVADTSVICRYVDRQFPEKSIYPTDPKDEARATWLEEFADSKLVECCAVLFREKFLNPSMFSTPTNEAAVTNVLENQMPPLLQYLESQMPESGPLVGDSISIADLSIIACFLQARYGDFEVDGALYPKLRAYLDRAYAHDVVAARMTQEAAAVKSLMA